MILFWKKLLFNKKWHLFIHKSYRNTQSLAVLLFGLIVVLVSSCIEGDGSSQECNPPVGTGTFAFKIPRIPNSSSTNCSYNPSTLDSDVDTQREFADGTDKWVIFIHMAGKCSNGKVWDIPFKKGDYRFIKNFDGSFDITLLNVPQNEPVKVTFELYSPCESSINCPAAEFRYYRAFLTTGAEAVTTNNFYEFPALTEFGIFEGSRSGCN